MRITKDQGITLVALVITIIVLLILAGVALATLTGNGSIIDNANYAVTEYNKSANEDQNVIDGVENLFEKYLSNAPLSQAQIIQQQYGGLLTEEDTIEPELFTWEPITEPGVAVVRHTPDNGTDGVVSRGDTPTIVTQKGTAKITGINWSYFLEEVEEEEESDYECERAESRGGECFIVNIKTSEKQEEIEAALRRLIIPYEVTREVDGETRTYTVVAVNNAGPELILYQGEENNSAAPILAHGSGNEYSDYDDTYPGNYTSDESDTSYLIIPSSVNTLTNFDTIPRNILMFSPNSPITKIPDRFFLNNEYLKGIVLPNGLKEIGQSSFYNSRLRSITIPDSVTTMGQYAFENCTDLETAIIGNGIKAISAEAFAHCLKLESITIPNGVTTIGNLAFNDCGELTRIYIPSTVTTIGDSAFEIDLTGDATEVATTIYYGGTEAQWNSISKGEKAFLYRTVTMVYESNGIPQN